MARYLKYVLLAVFGLITLQLVGQTFQTTKYYDDEKQEVQEIIEFRSYDSIPNGSYKSFYQNGNLKIEGNYRNGVPEGLWRYYFESGRKRTEGYYREAIQQGKWRYYFESGQLKATGPLDNGKKTGYWTNYYENGNEKSSGSYFKDLKEGIWNYFFEDGSSKAQAYYEAGNGSYKQYYPSGSIKMQGYNAQGVSEGTWEYYFETGELQAIGGFQKGLRHGQWEFYHRNGNVSASGKYENGKKTGLWTYYHENGQKSSEGDHVEGARDGEWNLYYESGEVKAIGSYDQGDGIYTEYYPSGTQKAKGEIKDGKRHSTWIFFNEDGVMDGEAQFRSGKGEYTGYYPDQSVKMRGTLEDEKRVGEWKLYNPDGSLAGVYRPIYEEEKPFYKIAEIPPADELRGRGPSEKPEYIFKKQSIRYFRKKVNEYAGWILAGNPAWLALDQFLVSGEYYFQERAGYELQLIYHRDPFFKLSSNASLNEVISTGVGVFFRQKFYHPEGKLGMFYFGHQVNLTFLNHNAEVQDMTVLPFQRTEIQSNEVLGAYGLFVGIRWMRNGQSPGFTIDTYVGADVGFRNWERRYDETNQDFNDVFQSFDQGGLYVPIRFGINLGWTIRRKSKTSSNK
ncbi:MAG: toxin-antitoxin system YwqK family antitoxin [Bacteroidota bacterium]